MYYSWAEDPSSFSLLFCKAWSQRTQAELDEKLNGLNRRERLFPSEELKGLRAEAARAKRAFEASL